MVDYIQKSGYHTILLTTWSWWSIWNILSVTIQFFPTWPDLPYKSYGNV